MTTLPFPSRAFSATLDAKADDQAELVLQTQNNHVQFDLSPGSMERLNTLKLKTAAASYADVVKHALQLYEALIEESQAGKQFYVRTATGPLAPYHLFN